MMYTIVDTTDGQFIGLKFDPTLPIILLGNIFTPQGYIVLSKTELRFFNSNYVIDVKET